VRIIGGENKNYRFQMPNKLAVRPTTDFCKENLFNILNNTLDFSRLTVLDLFAGSGNISYEFISRGSTVTSVDKNPKCVQFIKYNLEKLKADATIKKIDCLNYLKNVDTKFDLIFADPPFNFEEKLYITIIDLIFEKKILKNDGILIIEHNKFLNFKNSNYFYHNRKYGDVNFSFFKSLES